MESARQIEGTLRGRSVEGSVDRVSLREVLESDAYQASTSTLTLPLGKTIQGEPYVVDLAGLPHLLIAGSAGTGKSVTLRAMIASILFRATPEHVRLILIDIAHHELAVYGGIPHLLAPIVVDPKHASNALWWTVGEMERRYRMLAARGVRNIQQYNRATQTARTERDAANDVDRPAPLPFIVVVIDELAEVMTVAGHEVEESVSRLAQMARAVGIHLILATQRFNIDVITGLIKANMPSRISFRVTSQVDSRTILDCNGAEQMLRSGDMLFLPPSSSRLIRLHGPYVSNEECVSVAGFLRGQGAPVFDQPITSDNQQFGPGQRDFDDELYDEATRIVVSSGDASISTLQRRLRIGFSRAARLLDRMREDGLI